MGSYKVTLVYDNVVTLIIEIRADSFFRAEEAVIKEIRRQEKEMFPGREETAIKVLEIENLEVLST